jgi:hypothetical protein
VCGNLFSRFDYPARCNDFPSAELFDTNFTGARTGGTIFGENNLSGVKGLERVKHYAPSIIGVETIYRA